MTSCIVIDINIDQCYNTDQLNAIYKKQICLIIFVKDFDQIVWFVDSLIWKRLWQRPRFEFQLIISIRFCQKSRLNNNLHMSLSFCPAINYQRKKIFNSFLSKILTKSNFFFVVLQHCQQNHFDVSFRQRYFNIQKFVCFTVW